MPRQILTSNNRNVVDKIKNVRIIQKGIKSDVMKRKDGSKNQGISKHIDRRSKLRKKDNTCEKATPQIMKIGIKHSIHRAAMF